MTDRIDTAMVLAAGLGKRMRPLSESRPKPLVVLGGQTLLDRVLNRVADAGITKAVVNVHYHADQVETAIAQRNQPVITISDERDRLLDTGGGIAKALPLLGNRPFLVHNSDSVWIEGVEPNLDRLLGAWNPEQMDCLMLLALTKSSLGFDGPGDFEMTPQGRLQRRRDREIAPFVFTGVSIVHPRMFEAAPDGAFSMNELWDRAIEQERLFGIRLEGVWMHVGTPDALVEAEHALTELPDF